MPLHVGRSCRHVDALLRKSDDIHVYQKARRSLSGSLLHYHFQQRRDNETVKMPQVSQTVYRPLQKSNLGLPPDYL